MTRLRSALPWLFGVGVLAVLLARVEIGPTLAALREADLRVYLPIAIAFVGLWLALDAFVLRALFACVGARVSFAEMVHERAATYPWMVVSFDLANAALVAGLRRRSRAPLASLVGAMLAHYLCDLVALTTIAAAAALATAGPFAEVLRPVLLGLALLAVSVLVLGRLGVSALGHGRLADSLRGFRARDLARVVALRWVFYASFALFVWLTLPCFELDAPFVDVLARMPLVQSVAALPIAPAGVGTAQAAMLALFTGFGPPARWLAYSLAYGATLILLRLPLGFAAFWRRVELAA